MSRPKDLVLQESYDALLREVRLFEEQSGLRITQYAGVNLGKLVREYQELRGLDKPGLELAEQQLAGAVEMLQRMHRAAQRNLDEFRRLKDFALSTDSKATKRGMER